MNLKELKSLYSGKNVYITGITGFKGSWLAIMLHYLGANVFGVGLLPDEESVFNLCRVEDFATVDIVDITGPAFNDYNVSFATSLINADPDYVFHLAAQAIVSEGYQHPHNTFLTNIMGTVNLHEVLRGFASGRDKIISLLNVTTDKVYRESTGKQVETGELRGYDPYSLSKSCSDMISQCYRECLNNHSPKLRISTARAGNVVGGGDFSQNRIVPDAVRATKNKTLLEIRNPNSVRPYQLVFDALNAYLQIAAAQYNSDKVCGSYNVGPTEKPMTTLELVNKLKMFMDFDFELTGQSIGHESEYLALDVNKIQNELGWTPLIPNNSDICKLTANWYNKYSETPEDMLPFTLNQIKEIYNDN